MIKYCIFVFYKILYCFYLELEDLKALKKIFWVKFLGQLVKSVSGKIYKGSLIIDGKSSTTVTVTECTVQQTVNCPAKVSVGGFTAYSYNTVIPAFVRFSYLAPLHRRFSFGTYLISHFTHFTIPWKSKV